MKRFFVPIMFLFIAFIVGLFLFGPATAQEPTPATPQATGVVPTDTLAKTIDVLHQTAAERNQLIKIATDLQNRVRFLEFILQSSFKDAPETDGPPPPPDADNSTKAEEPKVEVDLRPRSILTPNSTT